MGKYHTTFETFMPVLWQSRTHVQPEMDSAKFGLMQDHLNCQAPSL